MEAADGRVEEKSGSEIQAGNQGDERKVKTVSVRALMFARARELAGISEATLDICDGWTTSQCFEEILSRYPALKAISSCMVVALNHSYVVEPVVVKDGDELALIPPISGG